MPLFGKSKTEKQGKAASLTSGILLHSCLFCVRHRGQFCNWLCVYPLLSPMAKKARCQLPPFMTLRWPVSDVAGITGNGNPVFVEQRVQIIPEATGRSG